ncbi:peptidoglycan-binding protein [Nocardia sp. NPDC127526]|uniref:peptidoglycan-binding domain-containing protein n=1 Tax=Nocardia sp. NPDC127526 TaxID=3345393 RepID=UPI0036286EAF
MKLRSLFAASAVASAVLLGSAAPALADAPAKTAYGCDYTAKQPTLSLGSEGEAVKQAQCLLFGHGYDPGYVDGKFGDLTASAVYLFQLDHGLDADRVVGAKTWAALNA